MSIDSIGPTFGTLYKQLCLNADCRPAKESLASVLDSLYNELFILPCVFKNRADCVAKTLEETHRNFHIILDEIHSKDIPRFIEDLSGCYRENRTTISKGVAESAEKIARFYATVCGFMEGVISREYPAATLIAHSKFCDRCFKDYKTIRQIHDITRLQAEYGMDFPLGSFIDLSLGRTANDEPINYFIKHFIQNRNSSVTLHNALKAIYCHAVSRHMSPDDKKVQSERSLQRVEIYLDDQKVKMNIPDDLFSQIDPDYLAWRDNLKPGSTLSRTFTIVRGDTPVTRLYTIVLGECIERKNHKQDYNLYFQIAAMKWKEVPQDHVQDDFVNPFFFAEDTQHHDPSEYVVWLSFNSAMMKIRKEIADRHFGLPLNQIKAVSDDGYIALVPRLEMQLGSDDWKAVMRIPSHKGVINTLFAWLANQYSTPQPFKLRHLRFDSQGVLRTTRQTAQGNFNLKSLEKMAFKIACNDPELFKQYMTDSEMLANSSFRLVVKAGLNTFQKEKFALEYHIQGARSPDPNLKQRALEIQEKIEKRLQDLSKGRNLTPEQLKDLKIEIINQYKNSGAAHLLLST